MFGSYLRLALRSLRRNRGYALINIVGLGVGMAAFLLIMLFVEDELSYDRYHPQADQVYRITQERLTPAGATAMHAVLVDPPIAPLIKAEIPEVVQAARLTPVSPSLRVGERVVDSGSCFWADTDIFAILDLGLVQGNAATALTEPFSIVLSESKARALFGEEQALGADVVVNNDETFRVTGIMRDPRADTHLAIDVLGSMATMQSWFGELGWGSPNYATYVRLVDNAATGTVEEKLAEVVARHGDAEEARLSRFHLQPLTSIHLKSHLVGELGANGDIRYVYLFTAIAVFILGIACINFMNLSTARSTQRAKEVGVRGVLGASRRELVSQFLGESLVLAALSLVLAIVLVEVALPVLNAFVGKSMSLRSTHVARHALILAGVLLVVGLGAGFYPAVVLSRFRPAHILRGRFARTPAGARFRSVLVASQFVVAIVLLICTLTVHRQLAFVGDQDLGFDHEEMLVLPTVWDLKENFDQFRQQLLNNPDIVEVAQSNPVPSRRLSFSVEAAVLDERQSGTPSATLFPVFADQHFFPAYRIAFAAGRNFSDEFASDASTGFIRNEAAVKALGGGSPTEMVGQRLRVGGWGGNVIGVVRDFHLESLHQTIAPMVFYMDARNYRLVSVRLRPGRDLAGVLGFLEERWQAYEPDRPLSYSFLGDRLDRVYEEEERLSNVFGLFAGLAVFITCLGVLGLVAYSVEQRTKEIGIRKVLGATAAGIVVLFSRDYVRLVVIAMLVAAPVAYLALDRWLGTFAYHANMSGWVFATAGLAALFIAVLTVGVQAGRAALANTVQSLRYE